MLGTDFERVQGKAVEMERTTEQMSYFKTNKHRTGHSVPIRFAAPAQAMVGSYPDGFAKGYTTPIKTVRCPASSFMRVSVVPSQPFTLRRALHIGGYLAIDSTTNLFILEAVNMKFEKAWAFKECRCYLAIVYQAVTFVSQCINAIR